MFRNKENNKCDTGCPKYFVDNHNSDSIDEEDYTCVSNCTGNKIYISSNNECVSNCV